MKPALLAAMWLFFAPFALAQEAPAAAAPAEAPTPPAAPLKPGELTPELKKQLGENVLANCMNATANQAEFVVRRVRGDADAQNVYCECMAEDIASIAKAEDIFFIQRHGQASPAMQIRLMDRSKNCNAKLPKMM